MKLKFLLWKSGKLYCQQVLDAKNAGFCFGVDHEEFLKALTKPRVRVGTEWVNKGQNLEQVSFINEKLRRGILIIRVFRSN